MSASQNENKREAHIIIISATCLIAYIWGRNRRRHTSLRRFIEFNYTHKKSELMYTTDIQRNERGIKQKLGNIRGLQLCEIT